MTKTLFLNVTDCKLYNILYIISNINNIYLFIIIHFCFGLISDTQKKNISVVKDSTLHLTSFFLTE